MTQEQQIAVQNIAQIFQHHHNARFAITHARKVDARGIAEHTWVICDGNTIVATGTSDDEFESACRAYAIAIPKSHNTCDSAVAFAQLTQQDSYYQDSYCIDAHNLTLTPGFIDIHAHGAWGYSFDDGLEHIPTARAAHLMHGTTRQVLSLITNPLPVLLRNIQAVQAISVNRPDILGSHVEGPCIAFAHKGAHNPDFLRTPTPQLIDNVLTDACGSLRQFTLAPELPGAIEAIRQLSQAGVVPAIGHCETDYHTAQQGFQAGARVLTHMFNGMNGLHHRNPGPIAAAIEDSHVVCELIADGFHVDDAMIRIAFQLAPHRIALITDAMAATDCPDGHYQLGTLPVEVIDGHARVQGNGAIAGSTLVLEHAVQRAITNIGINAVSAIEAATLTPARALRIHQPNSITTAPLGLIAPHYAADLLLLDHNWQVQHVWCNARTIR